MKVYGWLFFVLAVVGTSMVHCEEKEERQAAAIAGAIAKEVLPILLDFAKALFKKIWDNWVDKDNLDVVFMGRAFRIHTDSENQVTVTDRASSQAVTMTGVTLQAATNSACQDLAKKLLLTGVMSVDDLHLPPTLPPPTHPPCGDKMGMSYCKSMVRNGYCEPGNVFQTFMATNCFKSCNGC